MPPSGVLCHVARVRTDVSEERIASIIRVRRIGKLGTTLAVLWLLVTANIPSSLILVTLMMEAIHSSETSVLTRATWCHISEDGFLQCQISLYSQRYPNFVYTCLRKNICCQTPVKEINFLITCVRPQNWESKIWSWVLQVWPEIDCTGEPHQGCKLQSHLLIREGAPHQQPTTA
jgi:hypothetical protein